MSGEAQAGTRANQIDMREAHGVVVQVESRWSVVALAVAALALGVAFHSASNVLVRMMEVTRELSNEKRLQTNAIDELRLETRQAIRAAGLRTQDVNDHTGEKP